MTDFHNELIRDKLLLVADIADITVDKMGTSGAVRFSYIEGGGKKTTYQVKTYHDDDEIPAEGERDISLLHANLLVRLEAQ